VWKSSSSIFQGSCTIWITTFTKCYRGIPFFWHMVSPGISCLLKQLNVLKYWAFDCLEIGMYFELGSPALNIDYLIFFKPCFALKTFTYLKTANPAAFKTFPSRFFTFLDPTNVHCTNNGISPVTFCEFNSILVVHKPWKIGGKISTQNIQKKLVVWKLSDATVNASKLYLY
jgi:hypothetical protein